MAWIEAKSKNSLRIVWRKQNKRCILQLGRCSKRKAQTILSKFEELLDFQRAGQEASATLCQWSSELDFEIQIQLEQFGLIPRHSYHTLSSWCTHYLYTHKKTSAETKIKWKNTFKRLRTQFKDDFRIDKFTVEDAEQFRTKLETEGNTRNDGPLAAATVNKHCSIAKQLFELAVSAELISKNPFAKIETTNRVDRQRKEYVEAEKVERLIDVMPNWQDRLILALARFGGLRIPSEILQLRWEHIHFGNGVDEPGYLLIENVKTKHHVNVEPYRRVPMFPELKPYIDDAWEMRSKSPYVLHSLDQLERFRDDPRKLNIRRRFERAFKRAGLERWPKLFHNLRASCQTDLAERFPLHCVVEWLGNSERVAMKHYLQVTDRQFSEAAGVAQGVAPAQVIGNQGISENSPTLKNKASPVIDHHDLSQEMPEWAMRDSNPRHLRCKRSALAN